MIEVNTSHHPKHYGQNTKKVFTKKQNLHVINVNTSRHHSVEDQRRGHVAAPGQHLEAEMLGNVEGNTTCVKAADF